MSAMIDELVAQTALKIIRVSSATNNDFVPIVEASKVMIEKTTREIRQDRDEQERQKWIANERIAVLEEEVKALRDKRYQDELLKWYKEQQAEISDDPEGCPVPRQP